MSVNQPDWSLCYIAERPRVGPERWEHLCLPPDAPGAVTAMTLPGRRSSSACESGWGKEQVEQNLTWSLPLKQEVQCRRTNVGVYFCVVRLRAGAACTPLLLFTRWSERTGHTDTWNAYGNCSFVSCVPLPPLLLHKPDELCSSVCV